jgi:hypothetical protein
MDASPYGVYTAAFVDPALIEHAVVLPGGERVTIEPSSSTQPLEDPAPAALPGPLPTGTTRQAPLGLVAGARSGDKGGTANIGVWARSQDGWRWLANALTVEEVRKLLPETAGLPVTRYVLPHLRAVNFVVDGILGEGVSSSARFDPQGKALGEWLRSQIMPIPEVLL